MEAKLMPTKEGKGYKIIVDGTWLYASKKQMLAAILNEGVCTFREIENSEQAPAVAAAPIAAA